MIFGTTPQSAEREQRADQLTESEDMLFDFFDFFDKTIDDVYAYIVHRTQDAEMTEDIILNVYFSLLQRRRFFWWRKVVHISTVLLIADKAIRSKVQSDSVDQVMTEEQLEQFLGSINYEPLSHQKKVQLRVALLEKYRSTQMSNIRFVPSAAMATAAVGCFMIVSSAFLSPLSAQGTLKQIAAMEVLLTENQIAYGEDLLEVEEGMRGVAAHFTEKDLASLTLELAPLALEKQLLHEKEIGRILRKMGTRGILLSLIAPEAFAEEQRNSVRSP